MPTIGHYRLDTLLGRGGFGEVWKAWDERLNRTVALKLLAAAEPEDLKRFLREAQTAAALSHPNIAAVYEVGSDGDRHFIAMQLIDGATLRPGPDAVRRLRDAARAVHAAHERGIVHRDLKPANIMVDRGGRAFVLDFGLARTVKARSSLTVSGMLIGTPAYMAPEQARGETADARSDVYALGATLYELVAGRPPFAADQLYDLLLRVVSEDPAPPPCDRDLRAIILRCLEKEPARRYATAAALADDLTHFLEGEPVSAREPTLLYRARKFASRRRALLLSAAGAAILAAGIFAGAAAVQRRRASSTHETAARAILGALPVGRRERIDALLRADERLRRADRPDLRFDVNREIGDLALAAGDFGLARLAFAQCDELRPGGRLVEASERRRDDELRRRAQWVRDAVADVRGGLARPGRPRGAPTIEEYERECLRYDDEQTVAILGEALAGVARPGALDDDERAMAAFAMSVLGRLDLDSAVAPLAHAMAALDDPKLAVICGEALCNTRRASAQEAVVAARDRFGQNSTVWRQIERFVARVPDPTDAAEPTDAKALTDRGLLRCDKGDLAGALSDYTRAIQLQPDRPYMYVNRGLVRFLQGDVEGAIADYSRAIELDDRSAAAWINRGDARIDRGDLDGAIDDFTRALACETDNADADAYDGRGRARLRKGDHAGADEDHSRAVQLRPDAAKFHSNRGNARRLAGRLDEAISDFSRAIELEPRMAAFHLNRGLARQDKRDMDGALADFTRAIEIDPATRGAYVHRGVIRRDQGDVDGAFGDLSRAVALDPGDPQPVNLRGTLRHQRGDAKGAIEDFSRAIELDARFADAYCNRGILRCEQGDLSGAIADCNRAIELDPASARAHGNRAVVRHAQRDAAGAIADCTRALEINPSYADALANRGMIRGRTGDYAAAIADMERFLTMAPNDAKVPQVKTELARARAAQRK